MNNIYNKNNVDSNAHKTRPNKPNQLTNVMFPSLFSRRWTASSSSWLRTVK